MQASLKSNSLLRNTLWMFGGQGLRLVIQAMYFMAIARSLGVSNYGAFVGVTALVGVTFPFGSLGSGHLLIRQVARDRNKFPLAWGEALATTSLVSSALVLLILMTARFTLPSSIPLQLVFLVAISDLFGLSVITIASQAFQAFELLKWTAAINVLISASRLAGAIIMIALVRHPSPLQWGYVYGGSTAVAAIIAFRMVTAQLGLPKFALRRSWRQIKDGLYFSVSLASQSIYNDLDKTMLARLSTLGATGIYGAAYRIIDVSFAPVLALLHASYPGFFRKGQMGLAETLPYTRSLLIRAVSYSLGACLLLMLTAGLIPTFLGGEYAGAVEALRWLAPLPVLKAVHYFLSDTLTGTGYQALRSSIQASVAVFNVLINFWLIPTYSWRGAAWASLASDGLLAVSVAIAVAILALRPGTAVTIPS